MEDNYILQLFLTRSEQAVTELDRKYGRLCRRISFNILNNMEDVEECLNDTYLGVWNSIPPNMPDSLRPYVCRIARNTALKKYRYEHAGKRSCMHELPLEELEGYITGSASVEDTVRLHELTKMIEKFLDSLDEENRVIFVRRYWLMEPVKDIAAALNVSERNASMKLWRIRKKLKQYLVKEGVFL